MMKQKNRRKNYFIKKKFQGNFIFRFSFLLILGLVLSGTILYLFSRGTLTTTFVNSRLSIVNTAHYILPGLLGSSLITIVLVSLATAVVIMYLSHRIAGPLYKVERSAQEIGAGDLTLKIRLRSTDEMAKLADCFNQMTEDLKKHLLEIKTKSEDLGKYLTALKEKDTAKELLEKKRQLDSAIDYFKVGA